MPTRQCRSAAGSKYRRATGRQPPLPGLNLPPAGDLIEIRIKDTGTGIPEEHLAKIFDPYFTTKEKGSGLGLATSHSIIANHGGAITVSSQLGKGSTFTIYLPASAAQPETARPDPRSETAKKGRILLMDDEPIVRMVARELLKELGHEAAFAEDGDSAIGMYKDAMASGIPFDIVILDLTIRGGMGGAEALKHLLAIDPGVKTVVSSGYSDDSVASSYRAQGFLAYLKKPYDIKELEDILNGLLA